VKIIKRLHWQKKGNLLGGAAITTLNCFLSPIFLCYYLEKPWYGALFIFAAVAFAVTGILSAPLVVFAVALVAFLVSLGVAGMFLFKYLDNTDEASRSKTIEQNSDYNRITHLLDQTPYNSTIEKIQTRIGVKNDNIKKIKGIASVAGGHSIENNGENKSPASNPTLSAKDQLEGSGESSRLLNSR
jgi:membrane protein implicated in regulation of membrane protease activity